MVKYQSLLRAIIGIAGVIIYWMIHFIPLGIFFAGDTHGLSRGAIFGICLPIILLGSLFLLVPILSLKKITITKDFIRISLFGRVLREFPIESIAEIRICYFVGTTGNDEVYSMVNVVFSKIHIPDYLPSKEEREHIKKQQMKYLLNKKYIPCLKEFFGTLIKETRLLFSIPEVELQEHTVGEPYGEIMIVREKRFAASGAPMLCCINGKAVAKVENGETIILKVDQSKNELWICMNPAPTNIVESHYIYSNLGMKSNSILIDGRNALEKFKVKLDMVEKEIKLVLEQVCLNSED